MFTEDPQVKIINRTLKEGDRFYPNTRVIQGDWPKMASKGRGKGKKPLLKACANQAEYDAFMADSKSDEPLQTLGE